MPPHPHTVLGARFGLDGSAPLTYRQLGALLGLSHERARQLCSEALLWLRHTLADNQAADAWAQEWLRRRGGRYAR